MPDPGRCAACPAADPCPARSGAVACADLVRATAEHRASRARRVAEARTLLADLRRVRACPHWRDGSDTPCGCHRCALGKGRGGVVTPRECLACPDLPGKEC